MKSGKARIKGTEILYILLCIHTAKVVQWEDGIEQREYLVLA